jgi:inosine/xanthosine triphosphatase
VEPESDSDRFPLGDVREPHAERVTERVFGWIPRSTVDAADLCLVSAARGLELVLSDALARAEHCDLAATEIAVLEALEHGHPSRSPGDESAARAGANGSAESAQRHATSARTLSTVLPFHRAALGSTNPAKVAAVREALVKLAPRCEVAALDVPSGVGHQPFGDDETRSGALERARSALTKSGADIGFGLEGGVQLDGDRVWLLSWVAAVDPAGREGYASGLRMLLPPSLGKGLREGVELGTLVDDLFGVKDAKSASGAIGLLTGGAVSRTDAFADLVAMSLAPWIHPDHYR